MLKTAQHYESDIVHLHEQTWYDPRYNYARAGSHSYDIRLPDNNTESHAFASVHNNQVIGFIAYDIDLEARSAHDLFVESYDIGNLIFIRDCATAICNLFEIYRFNRLEWNCISDNPAIHGYRRFIRICGGREVGTFKNKIRLLDGELHDQVFF